MFSIGLGIGAALTWGASNFLGGLTSRRVPRLTVLLVSQVAGLAPVVLAVILLGAPAPEVGLVVVGASAGIAGLAGLWAMYGAMVVGAISIAAPVAATAAVVPVVVAAAAGEPPGPLAAGGVGLALAGVALVGSERRAGGRPAEGGRNPRRRSAWRVVATPGVGLALAAALTLGGYYVGINYAAEGGVAWAMLTSRTATVAVVLALALVRRPRLSLERTDAWLIVALGVLDAGGEALYALGTVEGTFGVVAVLSSLSTVVVVSIAWMVLHERPAPHQKLGIATAIAGVALIAGGG